MTTDASHVEALRAELQRRFSIDPQDVRIVCARYRICPLGAHIDHQLGRVTALAIDRAVYLAYAPSVDGEVRLQSLAYPGEVWFTLEGVAAGKAGDWGDYARGAVAALQSSGHGLRRGIVGVTAGGLGEGGLSSSAAVGVAYLLALEEVNGLEIPPWKNVELDRRIENDFLGLRNGILDQAAVLLSRREALTVIDCLEAAHEIVAQPASAQESAWLVAFSGVRQPIVSTSYNLRVEECAEAARELLATVGRGSERPRLGLVSAEEYARHGEVLRGAPARRARHFFSEMERVTRGIEAWRAGDVKAFGRLMSESGQSSIENYECGSPPLIDLYHTLIETDGVHGARFSGAGFRGCCIALVDAARAEAAAARVREHYVKLQPELAADAPVLICRSADGASFL